MKIINTLDSIESVYSNGAFDIAKWKEYISTVNPALEKLCFDDVESTVNSSSFTFEKDYLPILNKVIKSKDKVEEFNINFLKITADLENKIIEKFGKSIDVDLVLYLGLCNGAGWVVSIDEKAYCFLGIEKILELNWYDQNSLQGLVYHELGHVYHGQYGVLELPLVNNKQRFLHTLFTEGIAMYFEQTIVGDYDYYHQDVDGWKTWCDNHFQEIKQDFYHDLDRMSMSNQRYFGDWVNYKGRGDVGYYLGAKFIRFLCDKYNFDDILSFGIIEIEKLFIDFLEKD